VTREAVAARREEVTAATGEPVMLLHCTGGSGSQWHDIKEALGERFQVVAPDLCGYGDRPHWRGSGGFSLADEVALLAPLFDTLAQPVHIIGHSYGGAVALALARQFPDRARSLTVIEPAAFHLLMGGDDADQQALDEIRTIAAAVSEGLLCGDYVRAARRFVDYWSGEGTWAAMSEQKRTALVTRIGKVALDFWAALNEPTRLDDFTRLKIPTLVLRGSRSPLPPRRICWRLAGALPDAELRTVDGAGHMLPITHAKDVGQLILRQLDRDWCTSSRPRSRSQRLTRPLRGSTGANEVHPSWTGFAGRALRSTVTWLRGHLGRDAGQFDGAIAQHAGKRWCDSTERELNNRLMSGRNWIP